MVYKNLEPMRRLIEQSKFAESMQTLSRVREPMDAFFDAVIVNPPRPGVLREWRYDDQNVVLKKGEEMGRFLLGSTVVMLFPKGVMRFNADWTPTRPIRMGEAMGVTL